MSTTSRNWKNELNLSLNWISRSVWVVKALPRISQEGHGPRAPRSSVFRRRTASWQSALQTLKIFALTPKKQHEVGCLCCMPLTWSYWPNFLWVDLFSYDMLQPDWEKIVKKYKLLEHAWTLASIWFKAGCKLSVTTSKAEFWSRDAPPIDSCNCCP